MNLPFFISTRVSRQSEGTFSSIVKRIAVVSIGMGLAVLIVAFMLLFGFKTEIKNKIYSFGGHILISKYTLSSSFEQTSILLDDSLITLLENYEGIERYQPFAFKAGLLKALSTSEEHPTNEIQGVLFKGVDAHFGLKAFNQNILEGRFPNLGGEGYSKEVTLSKKIADYLYLQVGDEVMIYFVQNPPRYRRLKVVGIYETGMEEFDEKIIFGDLGLIRRLNNWTNSQAAGVEVFISDMDMLEKTEHDLFELLDAHLYVDKVTDLYSSVFDWLRLLNRNVVILFFIVLLVVGTGIVSILLILIMERTQMIGILKSMGARDALIRSIFVWNGMRLILKGLAWGNGIGIGIGLIQKHLKIVPLDPSNYYMYHVPIEMDWRTILGLNALFLVLIGLTLLIPVAFISRIRPVKSIRFD